MNRMVLSAITIDGEYTLIDDFKINQYNHHNSNTLPLLEFTHDNFIVTVDPQPSSFAWDELSGACCSGRSTKDKFGDNENLSFEVAHGSFTVTVRCSLHCELEYSIPAIDAMKAFQRAADITRYFEELSETV